MDTTTTKNQEQTAPPSREELVKFLQDQIELKTLQLTLQEINMKYAVARAEELKALSFIAQMTNPKSTDVINEENTVSHIITQEDLDNNPDLTEYGVKVGDEIRIPKEEEKVDIQQNTKPSSNKTLKKK